MVREPQEVPFLTNVGLLMTYKCQVACPHCVIGAGPNRKEEMSLASIVSCIAQAAAYRGGRIKAVCFTGGEPFYDIEKLKAAVLCAVSHGMVPTVVTNAFWADTPKRAREVLEEIGPLRIISVSADAYHQAQIPFEKVKNALQAARELGLLYEAAVCTEDVENLEYLDLYARLEHIIDKDRISTIITFPAGRALTKIKSFHYRMTVEPPAAACTGAAIPTVFPDGRVFACIGPIIDLKTPHPLLLGTLHEKSMAEIFDAAEQNAVLHILRVWGPRKLCKLLEAGGHSARLPRLFVENGMCNLCYSLMSDRDLCAAMQELSLDKELVEKTAYARSYYLSETGMLEKVESR